MLVATIRSTKMHGGVALDELALGENLEAVREGFEMYENISKTYKLMVYQLL